MVEERLGFWMLIHEPLYCLPLRIVHPYHHCRPLMTSENHPSFGVESSDYQNQSKSSLVREIYFSLKVTHDPAVIKHHL